MAWTIFAGARRPRRTGGGSTEVRVAVSTEDQELAAIARHYGAEVPFMRPAHLAEDTTATEPVIEHAIDFYTGEGWAPDAVMLLQATSPVRLPGTLARAVVNLPRTAKTHWLGLSRSVRLFGGGTRMLNLPQSSRLWRATPPRTHAGDLPVPGKRFALPHQNLRVHRAPQPFGGVSWRNY